MDLEQALGQFDAVEANLRRLENVWAEMRYIIPGNIVFLGSSPAALRYAELKRSYASILKGIPPIGDYKLETIPADVDSITQVRRDVMNLGEFELARQVEDGIERPTREIAEYRSRFRQARIELVRGRLQYLVAVINGLLPSLVSSVPSNREPVNHEDWTKLIGAFIEIERLAGGQIREVGRWSDMRRHLSWAMGCDVHDIANLDWNSVRYDIEASLYSELEPVPVSADNLAALVQAKPEGTVTTKLNWSAISAEDFERLIYNLISDAQGYVNPRWLMRTNAPDRGQDLWVDRLVTDALSGTRYEHVIIQAKRWTTKSVVPNDVSDRDPLFSTSSLNLRLV
jgi:hypothetical protein